MESDSSVLVKVRRALAFSVLAAAALAAFAIPAQGASQPREPEANPASGTVAVTDRVLLLS